MDDIGRYRILGELGSGGMGVVYRAYDPVLGRNVAIKTLRLIDLADPAERTSMRERLGREARAAAALSHSGIIAIHDVVQQEHVISLVMELIEGQTLAHILAGAAPIDLARILRIVRETAAALDYAHRKGIVHRDIKPANLMLDESGAVKVADFGIAKITASQTRTQSSGGVILGTAGYMAPEQLKGGTVDGRSDQFALAVVAYEMLARRRPFMAESLIALTHQVVFQQPPTISTLRPELGPALDPVFQKALAKSPEDRYETCSAFALALESQATKLVDQPTKLLPAMPPPKKKASPLLWMIPVVAILAVAGAGTAFVLRHMATPVPTAPIAKTAPPTDPPHADPPKAVTPVPPKPAPVKAPPVKAPTTVVVNTNAPRLNKKDSQKYVFIPAGAFTMGCVPDDADCGPFAKPAHKVTLSGFWMAQTETTTAAYKAFAEATHRDLPKAPKFNANWTLGDHPMVEMNWEDANAYCSWAGARLPTEAEWEYAARGGTPGTIFPWGNDASHDLANFGEGTVFPDERGAVSGKDQWMYTSPVASFPPNGFNLFDMAGNVSEWCSDWFATNYYSISAAKDPKGPESGTMKIFRGGSWKSPARLLHISFRGSGKPDARGMTSGFRCASTSLP